tara:strand:+ start:200 stop:442 length:243 start_codon:yes stop_codon:yes gene_type:complete
MLSDAEFFTEITPQLFFPLFSNVVDGFLVLAANAVIGSIPHLCMAREPTNGIEIVLQLGLKSEAIEKAHEFSTHFFIGGK